MDIRNLGANLSCDIRNNALEQLDVYGYTYLAHLRTGTGTAGLYFVVTAYYSKTCMVAYSLKVLTNLYNDVIKHTLVGHYVRTSKREIEEYYKTKLVANIEEVVVGIVAASPYSDSIEVGERASFEKLA